MFRMTDDSMANLPPGDSASPLGRLTLPLVCGMTLLFFAGDCYATLQAGGSWVSLVPGGIVLAIIAAAGSVSRASIRDRESGK